MDFVMRDDSIISTDPTKFIGLANATYNNAWSQFAMSNVVYTINKDTMAQMPEGVVPETWTLQYKPSYGDRVTRMVSVATKDNELYIKGFSKNSRGGSQRIYRWQQDGYAEPSAIGSRQEG